MISDSGIGRGDILSSANAASAFSAFHWLFQLLGSWLLAFQWLSFLVWWLVRFGGFLAFDTFRFFSTSVACVAFTPDRYLIQFTRPPTPLNNP